MSNSSPATETPFGSWLVTGASGRLGNQLCRYLANRGDRVTGWRHSRPIEIAGVADATVDLTSTPSVVRAIKEAGCRTVIHTAGLTNVDECEAHPDVARRIHVDATRRVAAAAHAAGARLVIISTDHLSDGRTPFVTEEMPTAPMNVYARTKRDGELAATKEAPDTLILRTNFFGVGRPWRPSFSDWVGVMLERGEPLNMFTDVYFSPIAIELLCPIVAEAAVTDARGVYNAAGRDRLSKYEFALRYARVFGLHTDGINATSIFDVSLAAPRPRDMSLSTDKIAGLLGRPMPGCDESLEALKRHRDDVCAAAPVDAERGD